MVDKDELRLWISRLETEGSSWTNYEKLAALYIIQDRQQGKPEASPVAMYSAAPAPDIMTVTVTGDSDFLRAVDGKDAERAWAVMDELMDTLRIVNERVYDSVMGKLKRI